MSFYPLLLRSATVKKFMVDYELFAKPQCDITAKMAAAVYETSPASPCEGFVNHQTPEFNQHFVFLPPRKKAGAVSSG